MESGDIGNIGECIVTSDLKSKGFLCFRNTQQPGSTDITAYKGDDKRLVQVKTGLYPNDPPKISGEEVRNISSRATRLGYSAFLATLQINSDRERVGEIKYKKLN
jgi:hypothetical protein